MILLPSIETVVILVPRTGSGTLKKTLLKQHPDAMMLYRHMEADGVPHGYDRWRKIGVVRQPADRLWSLYKFLQDFDREGKHHPAYSARMRESVSMPFCEWVVTNQDVFTSPYDSSGGLGFWPQHSCRHPLPETRKSQFHYLRPDLGTEIFQFGDWDGLAKRLNVEFGCHENRTHYQRNLPVATEAARRHMERWFAWDYEACAQRRAA